MEFRTIEDQTRYGLVIGILERCTKRLLSTEEKRKIYNICLHTSHEDIEGIYCFTDIINEVNERK